MIPKLENAGYTPATFRRDKAINMASVFSNIDLKMHVPDFWHVRLLYFHRRINLEK